jgi:hypothetical protein
VIYAPSWDARNNKLGFNPPQRTAPYANYLTALIRRYGPHGNYWSSHPDVPKLPVRQWQIWNEPNLSFYWTQPFAKTYVPLLKAAHDAIKKADPGAKVVLGALTNFAWRAVGQIYAIKGAARLFDVAAVNGFTKHVSGVITFMHLMRRAMNRAGDKLKPLIATEVSWPSAQGKSSDRFDFDTTEAGQARNIAAVMPSACSSGWRASTSTPGSGRRPSALRPSRSPGCSATRTARSRQSRRSRRSAAKRCR